MFRSYSVSDSHYAAKWVAPTDDNFHILDSVNDLAIRYADLPDGPEKESVSLELIRCFHSYLIKYTNMVTRGQLPNQKSRMGKDAAEMLRHMLPKGTRPDYALLSKTCKTLHLAFKGLTTDDVYDVMVLCFLRACRKYDPHYTDKVRLICEVIDGFGKQFTAEAVSEAMGFDATGIIRLLVRKRFLVSIGGTKRKIVGYQRGQDWPPDAGFFESGPIGFTYFAALWFRYYLAEFIIEKMGELESREGVLQLGHQSTFNGHGGSAPEGDRVWYNDLLPNSNGNIVDEHGQAWAADTTLMGAQYDVSEMTDSWVAETTDKLFRNLTPTERWTLQMIYRKEFSWVQIAAALQCSTQTARQRFQEIMVYLRGHAGTLEAA